MKILKIKFFILNVSFNFYDYGCNMIIVKVVLINFKFHAHKLSISCFLCKKQSSDVFHES